MFVNSIILILLTSNLYATSDKFHLEFSKDEEINHRHSIDSLEPELANSIFSNLLINPQKRTTVKPIIKKIKKIVKPSSEINFLVRVKKNSEKDLTSPDYANINNDFLHSDDIMFSHDEISDEMKQVKPYDANFLHQIKNVKQQVFVDDKSTVKKDIEKHADLETVTVILPSQDIQIDKEEKNWRKMTHTDFFSDKNNDQNLKKINEDENLVNKDGETKSLDDFFNTFDVFSEYSDISLREKRDIKNTKIRQNSFIQNRAYKKKIRKVRMGYVKIESEKNGAEKPDTNQDENTTVINNHNNLIDNIENNEEYHFEDINLQNTTRLTQISKNAEINSTDKILNLETNKTSVSSHLSKNLINTTTIFVEDMKHNSNVSNDEISMNKKTDESEILIKNKIINLINKNSSNINLLKPIMSNYLNINTKSDSYKNEEKKNSSEIFFNTSTTKNEMVTESLMQTIDSTTTAPIDEIASKVTQNITKNLSLNLTQNIQNNANNDTNKSTLKILENFATFPNDPVIQDDPIDSNSVYSDTVIANQEKPLKYKVYSMDLSSPSTTQKNILTKKKKVLSKVHDFHSHFLHPF